VDPQGRYTLVPTSGWEAETAVTAVALEAQDRLVRDAWELSRTGRRSSLCYHMVRRQMTPSLLAQNMGISRLRVFWHLQPLGFSRVSESILRRYAACLNLPPEELSLLPDAPESAL
jgi:hypothetical protein